MLTNDFIQNRYGDSHECFFFYFEYTDDFLIKKYRLFKFNLIK